MNRLVIIGNGFDLAHGLPTSYRDFIDDYWKRITDSKHNDLVSFNLEDYTVFEGQKNFKDLIENILKLNVNYKSNGFEAYRQTDYPIPMADNRVQIINYNNELFKLINKQSIVNWVDIENVYYKILKGISNGGKHNYLGDINKLNEEFEQVKNLLEKYLNENIEDKFFLNLPKEFVKVNYEFQNLLRPISVFNKETNLRLEFNNSEDRNDIDVFFNKEKQDPDLNKAEIRLLNFNYTSTLNRYFNSLIDNEIKIELNHIHGEIKNKNNRINFGFGDEMDEDYKAIENINNNEFLKNFKSFQYLQNSNYSDLLSYINSGKFQVLIMGHSCGLSDRTLLNTIFEHNNCRSIKVFYHEFENKETNEIKDNYTEITQNISRHFNKKKLMREKIVNKTLCKPLPQIQLPKFKMVHGMPLSIEN